MSGECSRNLRDASLTIIDGTPTTPNKLKIALDNGDLNWTEASPVDTIKHRGRLDHRRPGDEEEMEITFSVMFSQYSYNSGESTGVGVVDALKQQGGADDWASTDDNDCAPYATDLLFEIVDPSDPTKSEKLTFPKFVVTSVAFREGTPDTLSVTGRAFATKPTRTYGAVSA